MTEPTVIQNIISPRLQKTIKSAATSANAEISKHVSTHSTWRILPIEEKAAKIRSTFYSHLLEGVRTIEPDKTSVLQISSNRSIRFGNVNIIVIGNLGLHIISNLREECITLKKFRMKQKSPTLFDELIKDDLSIQFESLQIFQCIYRKKNHEIIEIQIMDRYDADCEPLNLEITDGKYVPQTENMAALAPKIKIKSSDKISTEDGKDVAQ